MRRISIHNVWSKSTRGFTLIELLVVVSIIALLLSMLMPALNRARYMAKRVMCATNQKTLVLAATVYQSSHNGKYPRNLGMDETKKPPTGLWPNKVTRDWDGDGRAFTYGEKISDYLGDSVTYDVLCCPLAKPSQDRYEKSKSYYDSGYSAWLYTSYAYYWNYALRPASGRTFIGPGITTSKHSKLLTSDLCVYSTYHNNRWFVSHPPKAGIPTYSDYMDGIVYEVPWPDNSSLYPVKLNVGSTDGSVVLIDSEDIVPVSFENPYPGLSIGVPLWATQ